MADIKIYGTLVSATTDRAIVKNEQVVGGFMVLTTAERDGLTTALKKEGMTIFCTDDSKYYRLSQGAWIEVLNTEGVITEDKLKVDVLNNASIRTEDDAMYLDLSKVNLDTKETGTIPVLLTLADATKSGIMSKSNYLTLQALVTRVDRLEGKTTRLLYTAGDNPTAGEINTFVEGEGYTSPFSGIAVVVVNTYHIWHYYENDNIGWRDDGVDVVNTFTNTVPGIIQGSEVDGKVFAETDGTGSVYGWDNLLTRVSEAEDAIGAKQDEITSTNKLSADLIESGNANKVFTSLEKQKLSGIAAGAQVNVIESIAVNGTDLTITNKKVNIELSTLDALTDAQKAALNSGITEDKVTEYDVHVANKQNPHEVTKEQIELGNVDNTSDLDKPISTATQTALDGKVDTVTGKGLSTNDFTDAEKFKLKEIEDNANRTIVDSTITALGTNPVQGKAIYDELNELKNYVVDNYLRKQTVAPLYNAVYGIAKDTGDQVIFSYDALEKTANKVTAIDSTNKTDTTKYTSVKAAADYVDSKTTYYISISAIYTDENYLNGTFTIDESYKNILTRTDSMSKIVFLDGAGEYIFYCEDQWNNLWFVVYRNNVTGITYYVELELNNDLLSGTITAYPLTTVSNEPLSLTVAESAINNTSGTQIADAMYAMLIDANKASETRIKLTNSTDSTTIMLTFNNSTQTEYNYTALVNNLYYTLNVKTGTANTVYITRDAFGVDTSDATANAADLLLDKTAYNADGKITGTIEDYNGEME